MSAALLSRVIEQVGDRKTARLRPAKVAERRSLALAGVAGLVHAHRHTLTRSPASPQAREGLGEVIRIIARAASPRAGPNDVGAAVLWVRHQPLSAIAGKTAEEPVRRGRAAAVPEHLQMLADGVHAPSMPLVAKGHS